MPLLKVPKQPQAATPSRGGVSQSSPMKAVPVLDWEKAARITRQRAGNDQTDIDLPGSLNSTITAPSPKSATKSGSATRKKPFRPGLTTIKGSPRNRFQRERLPVPKLYYEKEGLKLIGRGEWRSALCPFHKESQPQLSYPHRERRVHLHGMR